MNPPNITPKGELHTRKMPDCRKCGTQFDRRVKRDPFTRILLFWLPLKRFYCEKCMKYRYRLG